MHWIAGILRLSIPLSSISPDSRCRNSSPSSSSFRRSQSPGGLSALPGVLVEREVAVAGRWRVFLLGQCATASASASASASAVVKWIGSRYFRWPLTQLPTDPPDELFAERPGVRADHVAPVETGPQRMIDCAPGALDETGRHDTRVVQEALLHELSSICIREWVRRAGAGA